MERLLQRLKDEIHGHRPTDPPADDAAGEHINDEGHIDEALPSRYVGEVRDPQWIRPLGVKLSVDRVHGVRRGRRSAAVARMSLPWMTPRRP